MSGADRTQSPGPPRDGAAQAVPGEMIPAQEIRAAEPIAVSPPHTVRDGGPRFWALPDKNLGFWVLRENDQGIAGLTESAPSIFTPKLQPGDKARAAERCKALVSARLRDKSQEDAFNLIKRLLLGGMLGVAGLVGLRLPGELKFIDMLLLLSALGYSLYAGLRYGTRLMNSLEAASRPFAHFTGEPFTEHAFANRLARAYEFRRQLPAEKRGDSPDDELLDANAYRKLIRDGVVAKEDLIAVGKAIEARLVTPGGTAISVAEFAKSEGLDPEAAALYRDLAQAAGEIACDSPI